MATKRVKKVSTTQPSVRAVAVVSSGVNDGFDRTMTVTGRTTEETPIQVSSFRITQLGLREPFLPADSDEPFETADGEQFGVLKL